VLFVAFRALSVQLLVVSGLIGVCSLVAWFVDGRQAAMELLDFAVVRIKGPWVWTFGWGLAAFVVRQGRLLPLDLNGLLVANGASAIATGRIERSTHHVPAMWYTVPITALGALLTYAYGVRHDSVAQIGVFLAFCSIYYVAAFLLFHFVEVTRAFHGLFESMSEVKFKQLYSPLHLENLNTYLALTTAIGLVAIYAGFRGTLTAGFQFRDELWRTFLSTPLILFLPGTLFYNYYPRYVLRRILQHRVFETMERLAGADQVEMKELLLDLRESAVTSSELLPFLDHKSLPSYLLAVFFAISLAYNGDPAVRAFFDHLAQLGSR
jgi:hypothetical protein